jgi:hypothetical protein
VAQPGGATLRLTRTASEGIKCLVIRVADLAALSRHLDNRGVPHEPDARGLSIAPGFLFGTKLQFIAQAR